MSDFLAMGQFTVTVASANAPQHHAGARQRCVNHAYPYQKFEAVDPTGVKRLD
jgi:hypothetical protein